MSEVSAAAWCLVVCEMAKPEGLLVHVLHTFHSTFIYLFMISCAGR